MALLKSSLAIGAPGRWKRLERLAMAEVQNCTLNFGYGRPAAAPALTCAARKLAFAEVQLVGVRALVPEAAAVAVHG
ncbi:MAG: hypothetical protein AB7G13_34625 [Lautropia sp.]